MKKAELHAETVNKMLYLLYEFGLSLGPEGVVPLYDALPIPYHSGRGILSVHIPLHLVHVKDAFVSLCYVELPLDLVVVVRVFGEEKLPFTVELQVA